MKESHKKAFDSNLFNIFFLLKKKQQKMQRNLESISVFTLVRETISEKLLSNECIFKRVFVCFFREKYNVEKLFMHIIWRIDTLDKIRYWQNRSWYKQRTVIYCSWHFFWEYFLNLKVKGVHGCNFCRFMFQNLKCIKICWTIKFFKIRYFGKSKTKLFITVNKKQYTHFLS